MGKARLGDEVYYSGDQVENSGGGVGIRGTCDQWR